MKIKTKQSFCHSEQSEESPSCQRGGFLVTLGMTGLFCGGFLATLGMTVSSLLGIPHYLAAGVRSYARNERGFSLVEIIGMLTILTLVTLPMMMSFNIQKNNLERDRRYIENKFTINQIFDNLIIQHPDPVVAYTVTAKTSIYCDPGDNKKDLATYNSTCTSSGPDQNRGPFFTRTLSPVGSSDIKVDIQLFKTTGAANPYFTASREYKIGSYRVDVGNETTQNLNQFNNPKISDFGNRTIMDESGHPWYAVTDIPGNVLTGNYTTNYFFKTLNYLLNGDCAYTLNPSALPPPFDTYLQFRSNNCSTGLNYFFKVAPNTKYDANIYFNVPNNPTYTCIAGEDTVSCALADVRIQQFEKPGGARTSLVDKLNFDVAAASSGADGGNKGVVLNTSFETTDLDFLSISVNPTDPTGAGLSIVQLAGIELIRRSD